MRAVLALFEGGDRRGRWLSRMADKPAATLLHLAGLGSL